jgi:hypothetical protein
LKKQNRNVKLIYPAAILDNGTIVKNEFPGWDRLIKGKLSTPNQQPFNYQARSLPDGPIDGSEFSKSQATRSRQELTQPTADDMSYQGSQLSATLSSNQTTQTDLHENYNSQPLFKTPGDPLKNSKARSASTVRKNTTKTINNKPRDNPVSNQITHRETAGEKTSKLTASKITEREK